VSIDMSFNSNFRDIGTLRSFNEVILMDYMMFCDPKWLSTVWEPLLIRAGNRLFVGLLRRDVVRRSEKATTNGPNTRKLSTVYERRLPPSKNGASRHEYSRPISNRVTNLVARKR
jgi:hypothetical protein